MPNKDGVVSIGFDYKKELEEACSIIEKELNNIGGDVNLSEGLKKQIKELKTALESLQKDFSTSFDKIGKSKLDTKTFADFEKKVNKQLSSIKTEIGNLKSQLGSIDSSVGIDNISKQLNNLDSSTKKATKAVSDLINQTRANTKQGAFIDTSSTIKGLQEVKKLLADVSKEDYDFGHGSKSAIDLTKSLDGLIDKYYKIESEIDELFSSMQNIDKGTQTYKEQELQLSKMRLELGKCALEMDDILGATNSEKIDWNKTFLNEDDLFNLVDNALKKLKNFKVEAKKIIDSIDISIRQKNTPNSDIKEAKHDLSKGQVNIPVGLSTKQSTINKQLDEMIANLQERAAKSPIVTPVKLRVDSEYEKSEKDVNASSITQNQINEARKSAEGVIPGLEKAFNNSMRIATSKAVDTAKESIKSVREFFETNPIAVHLTVPDDEKAKIGKAILSEDGKNKVDISGEVEKTKKAVDELIQKLEKSKSIINGNKEDFAKLVGELRKVSNEPLEDNSIKKLSVDLDEVISKFNELISTVKTATNSLYKVIKAGNISELDKQWSSISNKFKSIADESGKINLAKQKKEVKELIEMYQKYESMGGTNSLVSITDNVETLRKLDSVYNKLNQTKDVDNSVNIKKESSSFNEVEKSVDSLTTAIGDKKVQAINIEATAMVDAAEREILAIRGILDNLDLIVDRLNSIKGIKLPKFDIGNIDKVQKTLESLNGLSGNKSNDSSPTKDAIQSEDKSINPSAITSYSSVLDRLSKSLQEINSLTNVPEIFKGLKVTEKQASNLTLLQKSLELINESLKKIDSDSSNGNFLNQITKLTKQADALKDLASILKSSKGKIKDTSGFVNIDDLANKKKSQLQSIQSIIDKYQPKLDSYGSREFKSNDYISKIDVIKNAIGELQDKKIALENSPSIATEEEINCVKELEKTIGDNIDAIKNMSSAAKGVSEKSIEKLISKISKSLEQNTRYSEKAKSELKGYLDLLETKDPSLNLEKIEAGFLRIINEERKAGREGKNFFDVFSDKIFLNRAAQLASYYLSFTDIIRYGQEGIKVVRELDTALTEMRKVSDETVSSLERFQDVSFDLADDVGTTAKQIQDSTADWMRLGEVMDDASVSAQVSNILLNVSEFEGINEATESLVAMSQAYKDLDKIEIVDVLNKIGNEYSISTDGIATALQDSASALVTANNDLNSAVALITSGNAVTQDPSKVGAGLRTIALRLVGTEEAKSELKELGEDVDDMVMTSSKVRETILSATKAASGGQGFDILDSNGNYKSTYEIMQGLADLYDEIIAKDKELGTNNLNLLLETIAGKNRANIAASILQNGEMLRSVYNDAQNADGSAQEELDKYLESIDGRMQKLENQAQEFWYKFIDSDTIKNGITLLTELLSLATDFVDTFGALGSIGIIGGGILGAKNLG